MEIHLEITNVDGEHLFSETCTSFRDAEDMLRRAEKYIGRKEVEAVSKEEDEF